jgi:carboxypeptidase Taq
MDQFLGIAARINDLLNAASVLAWDARTMMPAPGGGTRGRQIASLTVTAREILCAKDTLHALDAAEGTITDLASPEAAMVAAMRHAIDYHRRIPADLVQRRQELAVTAHDVWAEAKRERDFAIFAPALAETVDLCRSWAEAAGYAAHPYDALLEMYEPGNTVATLGPLMDRLSAFIRPLAAEVLALPQPDDRFLRAHYPPDAQIAVALQLAQAAGYDLSRGRLDTALHPFEISFTRNDVRLTTWVDPHWLPLSLFTTLHEAGHGIYEQNIDPAYTRTPLATDLVLLYAVGGVSFGMHESQSRLWENHVGKSRAFWDRHFGALHDAFPDQLAGVTPKAFWRAVNRVAPCSKMTLADELTYDLHTILRTEIERDLIGGSLSVRDVRDAWNAATESMLGVTVQDDAQGVLQDVHWATGQFGTFCNYTIGNIVAAQLYAAAMQVPEVHAASDRADYAPLRGWLTENVLRHGRRHDRDTLLRMSTGRTLDPAPYLSHLGLRFAEVYGTAPATLDHPTA